jgi:hypothetical protein
MQQQQWEQKLQVPSFSFLAEFNYWSKTNYWFIESKWYHSISSTLDTPGPMTKMLLIVEFFFCYEWRRQE